MSSLEPRRGNRLSRGQRTDQVFNYGVATAGLAVGGLVVFAFFSAGLGFLLLVLAAVFGYLTKRALG